MVAVIRYAVVTQACTDSPCRSSPMVRMAEATIVWSRAARNIPSISPASTSTICLWPSCAEGAAGDGVLGVGAATALLLMRRLLRRRHGDYPQTTREPPEAPDECASSHWTYAEEPSPTAATTAPAASAAALPGR